MSDIREALVARQREEYGESWDVLVPEVGWTLGRIIESVIEDALSDVTPRGERVKPSVEEAWESLRAELGHWLAQHDAELRAEVERLREGIEALADTKPGATGRALRALLAGSGEQPGEVDGYCTCHDDQKGRTRDCGVKDHREAGRPAPVAPDSADVDRARRAAWERYRSQIGLMADGYGAFRYGWDQALAVVGQGVAVEWGVGYGDRHEAAPSREDAEEWIADDDAWNPGEERWLVMRQVGSWTRAAARPSGQEGA